MWTRSVLMMPRTLLRMTLSAFAMLAGTASLVAQSPKFDVGRPATPEEIRGLGAAIAPDGTGLLEGSGSVAAGREVFA